MARATALVRSRRNRRRGSNGPSQRDHHARQRQPRPPSAEAVDEDHAREAGRPREPVAMRNHTLRSNCRNERPGGDEPSRRTSLRPSRAAIPASPSPGPSSTTAHPTIVVLSGGARPATGPAVAAHGRRAGAGCRTAAGRPEAIRPGRRRRAVGEASARRSRRRASRAKARSRPSAVRGDRSRSRSPRARTWDRASTADRHDRGPPGVPRRAARGEAANPGRGPSGAIRSGLEARMETRRSEASASPRMSSNTWPTAMYTG
jgi:hypothetical protein